MLSLAFDTATKWGRFALAAEGEVRAYRPVNVSGSYADALLPVIDDMLRECGAATADIGRIGVVHGPGSFTGLRIGVATAKGLAWGLGKPLFAVSSLAAMAAAMLDSHPDRELAVPALDARRGEIFSAVFRRSGNWVEPVEPEAALPAEKWWERVLGAVGDPEAPAYAGDGTALLLGEGDGLRPQLRSRGEPALRCWNSAHPATARALAAALESPEGMLGEVHPFALTPLYLRASEAEVKRGLDLTPLEPGDDIVSRTENDGAGGAD